MHDTFWTNNFSNNKSKTAKWPSILAKHAIYNYFDLLWLLPNKYQPIFDEDKLLFLNEVNPGGLIRVKGKISHVFFKPLFYRKRKGPLLHHVFAKLTTQRNRWQLYGFNLYPNAKEKWKNWEEQEAVTLIGSFDIVKGLPTLSNPKEESLEQDSKDRLVTYPAIKGLNAAQWKKLNAEIKGQHWDSFPDYPKELEVKKSFQIIHGILKVNSEEEKKAISNIKLLELWCEQMLILTKKELRLKIIVPALQPTSFEELSRKTPWPLTSEQNNTLKEILIDLASKHPMRRLLQGEVGSGKTILAFLSALSITQQNKVQVAILAPTETLARQHFEKWKSFFGDAKPITKTLFASSSTKEKKQTLADLKNGACQIVIGTHALFQKEVEFFDLRYIIIDEQHRFGVEQRKLLYQKGKHPHTLMMSATPIPRTLGLTHFGDLEQSFIHKTPFGDKKISTRLVEKNNYQNYLNFLKTRLDLGEQIYVVAPVIEESEHFSYHLKSLEIFFQENFSSYKIATLHGKLKEDEQQSSFALFQSGQASILIATTMIEVGIDVPNASVICIYHPEQFGLSSLHQLRGRVGRGKKSGFCFLVAPYHLDDLVKERLTFFEKNLDGFVLAEKDFNLRGQGNLWGLEQSGKLSPYKAASLPEDQELLMEAHELANKYHHQVSPLYPTHLRGTLSASDQPDHWL